jgi:uncharacterized protein (DUF885 family)
MASRASSTTNPPPLRAITLALTATAALTACRTPGGQGGPGALGGAGGGLEAAAVAARVEAYVDASLAADPDRAVENGLHAYDGRFVAPTPAHVAARVADARRFLAETDGVAAASLPDPLRLDLELTRLDARRTIHLLEERRLHTKILAYLGLFDVKVYLSRDYAPLATRVLRLVERVEAATAATDGILAMLDPEQPKTFLATAELALGGMREYYAKDVALAAAPALAADAALRARYDAAVAGAMTALGKLEAWIAAAKPRATDAFALGEAAFLTNLEVNEGRRYTLDALEKMAAEDHQRNYDAYVAAAAALAPGKPTAEVAAMLASEHLSWADVIPTATRQLDALLAFIDAKGIVTLPSKARATVVITPPFMRWNSAFLDPAGPFEVVDGSFYYLSPPDPSWPKEVQEGYLPYAADLLATSIHEVYPGHFLHNEKTRLAPSRTAKLFGSYAFTEGWAHYTEEMMVEAGFGEGDLRVRLGQLSNALLRNCRFLAAIGLHTRGMTVDEAERLFRDRCFVDAGNARQQAYRGTFDPGYLSYTLGKLEIRALRERFFAARGTRSLGAFHDWLLSFGAPPLALLDARL